MLALQAEFFLKRATSKTVQQKENIKMGKREWTQKDWKKM